MARMAFYDDRVSTGERRCRVAAACSKSEWKVTRAEHRDWSPRHEHSPKIRFGQRLALWIGAIDHRFDPRSFANYLREHSKLSAGASPLAGEPGAWQSCLRLAALQKLVAQAFDLRSDSLEKFGRPAWVAISHA